MSVWSSIKASVMRFPRYGGQQTASGTGIDWLTWGQSYPGTTYDYAAVAGPLYLNPVVMACVAWYQASLPSAEMQVVRREVQTGEDNKVPGHDLLKFMRRPNAFYSTKQLWQATLPDLLQHGNAYWLKIRNGSAEVIELWNVPQHRLKPQWNTSGREFIGSYLLQVEGDPQRVEVRDIVHFRMGQDPQNERLGWSPLRAGLREVAILNSAANHQGALIRNGCVPSHLLSPKPGGPPFTGDQVKALLALWASTCGGDKVGRAVASSLPMDATKIGFSMAELDLGSMTYAAADQVCALLGLSSMVVGIASGSEHKTYANYEEAARAAWRTGAIPLGSLLAATLDLQLLPDFGDAEQECIEWDYSGIDILQEDDNALAERLDNAVKCGRISRNEARAELGLPPVGDDGSPMRKAFDTPQPLTANGYPWDPLPEWAPEPEPMPVPGAEGGGMPESSGDAQAQAERPAPAAKYNDCHDERGQFCAGGGAGGPPPAAFSSLEVKDAAEVAKRAAEILGRDATPEELARAAAAPGGAAVVVRPALARGNVEVYWESPQGKGWRVLVKGGDGKPVMANLTLDRKATAPRGWGTSILANQAAAARALGIDRLETAAVGSGSSELKLKVGYYVWARLGYNNDESRTGMRGKIGGVRKTDLPDFLQGAEDLHAIMGTPGGREWWLAHGSSFNGVFSLRTGSRSLQVLREYARQKGVEGVDLDALKTKLLAFPERPEDGVEQPPVLNERDEQILDRIWGVVPANGAKALPLDAETVAAVEALGTGWFKLREMQKALALPEAVRVTRSDVEAGEVLWDETMPEATGILSAKPTNGKR